jgi:phenylacetate-coenzyme A ligase PaaK-like adenylate-forming protein
MWPSLLKFSPTHICAPATLVLEWLKGFSGFGTGKLKNLKIFHAGEHLNSATTEELSQCFGAKVINIYGLAEFDSVGAQVDIEPELILSPHLCYALHVEGQSEPQALRQGLKGELLIREHRLQKWYRTRDLVEVQKENCKNSLWDGQPAIIYLGRKDHVMVLPDGAKVSDAQVRAALLTCNHIVRFGQLQMIRPFGGVAKLVFCFVVDRKTYHGAAHSIVKKALLGACLELADATRCGVVSLKVKCVSPNELLTTTRGKRPLLIEIQT